MAPDKSVVPPEPAGPADESERWFAELTRKRIRRDTFRSVAELGRAIRECIRDNNRGTTFFLDGVGVQHPAKK